MNMNEHQKQIVNQKKMEKAQLAQIEAQEKAQKKQLRLQVLEMAARLTATKEGRTSKDVIEEAKKLFEFIEG